MTSPLDNLVHGLLSSTAAVHGDRAALLLPGAGPVTFGELEQQVGSIAAWTARHTSPGDRVAVIADNSAHYVQVYYAVPRAGRVLALINQRVSAEEQAALLAAAEPTVVVGDAGFLDALPARGRCAPSIRHVVPFQSDEWRAATRSTGDVDWIPTPDDLAWLLFTSGSTGAPKGVLHTHRSMTAGVRATIVARAMRGDDVYLLPFPMCHVAGHNLLAQHAVGSTVLLASQFRAAEFVDSVNEHGVTYCSLAPTMLNALVTYVEATGDTMPSLRTVAYGASPISVDLIRRAADRLDVDFYQSYGQTETVGTVTALGPADHRAGLEGDPSILRTAGYPHSEVEVRLADDADEDVDPGESGEVLLRGAQGMAGYWRDDEATAAAFVDGWIRTGDIGRLGVGGRLEIVDRRKDVIITGGENVSSVEVEGVLSTHPGVGMVAVVAVPDDYWGEAVCAVVVANGDTAPTEDELIAHVRAAIAPFKRPRHVLFVDELPMTSSGKVAKGDVRRLARSAIESTRSESDAERSERPDRAT